MRTLLGPAVLTLACASTIGPSVGVPDSAVADGAVAVADAVSAPLDVATPPVDAPRPDRFTATDHVVVCTLEGVTGAAACPGATPCPVDVSALIQCSGAVDSVRVAAGPAHSAWISLATVPGNRTTRLLTLDPLGSQFDNAPLADVETAFVLAAPDGPRLVGQAGAAGFGFATPGAGTPPWTWHRVGGVASDALFFDGAIDRAGTVYLLSGDLASSPSLVDSTTDGTAWVTQVPSPVTARGAVGLDATGLPWSVAWESTGGPPQLTLRGPRGATVIPAAFPVFESALQARWTLTASTVPGLPAFAGTVAAGPRVFVPEATGTFVAVAPPVPPALPDSACPTTCTATTQCAHRSAQMVPESLGVAFAGHDLWSAYLWEQVDTDITLTPGTGHGRRCQATVTADRSTRTLVVSAASSPPGAIRWQTLVTPAGAATVESMTSQGDRLLVTVTGASDGGWVRYYDLAASRL